MLFLLLASFIWAFSFGLIKGKLAGLDPTGIAVVRVALAAVLFLPLLRPKKIPRSVVLPLLVVGAVQFGVMYVLYLHAFHFLQAFEVALFTLTTPLYLAAFEAIRRKSVETKHAWAALLAVLGAAIVLWNAPPKGGVWTGFLLVQLSNACFALGQLAYRRIRVSTTNDFSNAQGFALLYLGALLVSGFYSLFTMDWRAFSPTATQWGTLAYLGLIASGLGFFWWNVGATQVKTGTLAAFNNAKIPLAVACSLIFFHEQTDRSRLIAGGGLLVLAVAIAEREKTEPRGA